MSVAAGPRWLTLDEALSCCVTTPDSPSCDREHVSLKTVDVGSIIKFKIVKLCFYWSPTKINKKYEKSRKVFWTICMEENKGHIRKLNFWFYFWSFQMFRSWSGFTFPLTNQQTAARVAPPFGTPTEGADWLFRCQSERLNQNINNCVTCQSDLTWTRIRFWELYWSQ